METEPNIVLTDEQQTAIDQAVDYFKGRHKLATNESTYFSIGGYAGTGKTTLIKSLVAELKHREAVVGVCAYTGKAASVLQRKGLHQATTIHRKIYSWDDSSQEFYLKPLNEFPYHVLIIDEASMISLELFEDLCNYNVPIIAVGDPGQLPPISKNDMNLVENPDVLLNRIHRQAEGNPIIELATAIRNQHLAFSFNTYDYGTTSLLRITDDAKDIGSMIATSDVIICTRNATRCDINDVKRKQLKRKTELDPGEKIIFLQNNPNLQVYNGQTATVLALLNRLSNEEIVVELRFDDGSKRTLPITTRFISQTKLDWNEIRHYRHIGIIDYAYALTCHKAQGSEWDSVGIIREPISFSGWDQPRWDYTAVTRASKTLRIFAE